MFISIIIPHYKDKERLLILLKNLECQLLNKNKWEVLVVNNDINSPLVFPDGFCVSYKLKVFEEPIPGSYAARNKGIKESKGDILAFTDSDCIPRNDWLVHAFSYFKRDKDKTIGVLTGPIPLFFKDSSSLSAAETYEKYTGFTTKAYASEGKAVTANWFSYAFVVQEFGGFDSSLKSNGDSKLSGQISLKYHIIYQDDIVVSHPARYRVDDLTSKYRRLLGGTYTRKYESKIFQFSFYLIRFILRRYRFAFKKMVTINLIESLKIFKVCHSINVNVFREFFSIVMGNPTSR